MNELQLSEIRNYLLDKKLPIDILIEVQDHFVSQINDLQRDENLNFEEAFEKTKNSWQSELKPYWDGGWDLLDKNNMTRKFEKNLMWATFKKSLKFAAAILLLLLLLAVVLRSDVYQHSFLLIVLAVIILPVLYLIKNFKSLMIPRKYDNYVLTLYQSFSFINLSFAYFLYLIITGFEKGAESFKSAAVVNFDWARMVIILFYFFSFIVSFFALISQKEYLKRIEKIKPFLKYLKPTN